MDAIEGSPTGLIPVTGTRHRQSIEQMFVIGSGTETLSTDDSSAQHLVADVDGGGIDPRGPERSGEDGGIPQGATLVIVVEEGKGIVVPSGDLTDP
jgi:hypothetical protein